MALAVKRDARRDVSGFRNRVEGRPAHGRRERRDGADGKGCRAMPGLAIRSDAADGFAPTPGVAVRCGPPLPDGPAADPPRGAGALPPPTKSPGRTIAVDRTVASRRVTPVADPDAARGVAAPGLDDTVALPELDGAVPVRDIYRGLTS